MKKLFTTLAIAAIATSAFAGIPVQKRLQMWGPYINQPANVDLIFDALPGNNDEPGDYHFYIWENTFDVEGGMDATVGEYQIFVCSNQGWAGCGLNIPKSKIDGVETGVKAFPAKEMADNWNVHFMWKTDMDCKITIGFGPEIGGQRAEFAYTSASNFKFDGTWNTVDLPLTDLLDQFTNTEEDMAYMLFFRNWTDVNLFSAVATDGCVSGGRYAVADMYFYINTEEDSVEGIAADGEVVAEEYYTFDGIKMAEAPVKGIYLVKKTFENGAVKTVKVAK